MGKVLVVDNGMSALADAIDRLMVRDSVRLNVPMTIKLTPRIMDFDPLPAMLPPPPVPKAGKNLNVGRYGEMPIPSGKRKKFKKRNRK